MTTTTIGPRSDGDEIDDEEENGTSTEGWEGRPCGFLHFGPRANKNKGGPDVRVLLVPN